MTRKPCRVIVRPEAEQNITDAAVWYDNQNPGLGREFLAEVDAAIRRAADNPFSTPPRDVLC